MTIYHSPGSEIQRDTLNKTIISSARTPLDAALMVECDPRHLLFQKEAKVEGVPLFSEEPPGATRKAHFAPFTAHPKPHPLPLPLPLLSPIHPSLFSHPSLPSLASSRFPLFTFFQPLFLSSTPSLGFDDNSSIDDDDDDYHPHWRRCIPPPNTPSTATATCSLPPKQEPSPRDKGNCHHLYQHPQTDDKRRKANEHYIPK